MADRSGKRVKGPRRRAVLPTKRKDRGKAGPTKTAPVALPLDPPLAPPECGGCFTRFAVESLSDAVYWVAEDARIVHVNDSACHMSGYDRKELVGMSITDLNPQVSLENWPDVWQNLKRAKRRTFQTVHQRKDGRTFAVEIVANFLERQGQEYSCAFVRDITDRKQLELRLRQAEKMEALGQLSGGVAHDFNNQLMGVMGYAEVLRVRARNEPKLAELAANIIHSAQRAADLTRQLLAFSRRGPFVSEPVDLHEIVGEVVSILSHTIDKRILVKQKLEAGFPVTTGDASQLQSAILNLALNARDAMPTGGVLTFATTNVKLDESSGPDEPFPFVSGDYARLSVSDTGEGIEADKLHRVFEPFFTTKGVKGTGLGLAAVYGTIRHHHGTVNVRSDIGNGTVVDVCLPVTKLARAEIARRDSERDALLRSTHVLVVDDEPAVRDVTRRLLEERGCKVTTAENGKEALAFYKESFKTVDVVLMDMVMPIMGGRETLQAMRAINPNVRALLTSGHGTEEDVQAALNNGARAFIEKPFAGSTLVLRIVETLRGEDHKAGVS